VLFLAKREWPTAFACLFALAGAGLGLRQVMPDPPALGFSAGTFLLGAAVFAGVLASDVLLHGVFVRAFGERYRRRHHELMVLFRGQSPKAIVAGAAMAGIGEELLFRGVSCQPLYLLGAVIVFGALHHVRRSLWPFTLWAGYQGAIFALVVHVTGAVGVTMIAHFLHDLAGFWIFKKLLHSEEAESIRRPAPKTT
jgi:membrane protease YdiL (CAAX protease family)